MEFELASLLFRQLEIPKKIDAVHHLANVLDIWAATVLKLGGKPPFTNHKDLYHVINSTCFGNVEWKGFNVGFNGEQQDRNSMSWMLDSYEVWYQDPWEVVHNMLASSEFADEMDYVPYQEYDASNDQRCWQDFMSGDWAWEQVDRIVNEDPTTAGAMLVPIILGSDKTTVSVVMGQTDYYPLYLSIGNVHNTVCCAHCKAVALIGFLAMPRTTQEHTSTPAFCKFKTCILDSLHPAMKDPETMLCTYIADYEEQVLLSCIHSNMIVDKFELCNIQENYELDGDIVVSTMTDCIQLFINDFPCADICEMLSSDILHQLIKGRFKDHLVDWTNIEMILDEINHQIAAIATFSGLQYFSQGWHFKQWTGNDLKGLMC
ncbi:hypothetical protein V8B97DRAFT_2026205 [Scleroderma yunnanense]